MLIIKNLDSWLDFEKIIRDRLNEDLETQLGGSHGYRGHSNAEWHLETTLERFTKSDLDVRAYYFIIKGIKSKIETFTDQKWDDFPSIEDYVRALKENPSYQNDSAFKYMTYLRHFGFPSPLLDWSFSPFVAAYFAFRDVLSTAKSVAIYEFFAIYSSFQSFVSSDRAQIFPITKTSKGNKRHELQQSFYTICLKEKEINDPTISIKTINNTYYQSHEDPSMEETEQIVKYVLPASEREIALHCLQSYNINAYSLFGTEESLLEALSLQIYNTAQIMKKTTELDNNQVW